MASDKKPVGKIEEEDDFVDDTQDEPTPETAAPVGPSGSITLTHEQLVQMLSSQTKVAEAIAKLADATDNGPVKQIPVSRALFRTPWNKEGVKRGKRIKLERRTFLNGHRLREMMLSVEEIDAFNSLKAGVYNSKRWTVQIKEAEGEGTGSECLVWIPNKSQGDRLRLAADSVSLVDPKRNGILAILDRILDEQKAVVLATR